MSSSRSCLILALYLSNAGVIERKILVCELRCQKVWHRFNCCPFKRLLQYRALVMEKNERGKKKNAKGLAETQGRKEIGRLTQTIKVKL